LINSAVTELVKVGLSTEQRLISVDVELTAHGYGYRKAPSGGSGIAAVSGSTYITITFVGCGGRARGRKEDASHCAVTRVIYTFPNLNLNPLPLSTHITSRPIYLRVPTRRKRTI
jgi:hypothetical protein